MGQGLYTKMIEVSPSGNRDGAGFAHKETCQIMKKTRHNVIHREL